MTEQGDVQIYVEGMSEPYEYFARLGETWSFKFEIADLGDNQRQFMRVWDPDKLEPPCNFSEEGWVDVLPGQAIDAGTIHFSVVSDVTCPVLFAPDWNHDGSALNYIYRVPHSADPENNLWEIESRAAVGSNGIRLLDFGAFEFRGKPY